MALRVVDNQMMMTRPVDIAGDRAREIRQSGLTTGTLRDISQDTEEDMHSVQNKPEVEEAYVRTDTESENPGAQEQPPREKEEKPQENDIYKQASDRLLNLPVNRGKFAEERKLDIRV